jgi:hypothetical protein
LLKWWSDVFLFIDSRPVRAAPILPPSGHQRAMGSPTLRLGSAVSFVNTATTSASAVLLTLYLQRQRQHNTTP